MVGSSRVPGLNALLVATADRLAKIMDALGLKKAGVAAHSRGRAVALLFAASPDHVRRLMPLRRRIHVALWGSAAALLQHADRSVFRKDDSIPPRGDGRRSRRRECTATGNEFRRMPLAGYVDGLEVPGTIGHVMQIVTRRRMDMAMLRAHLGTMQEVPMLLIWGDRDRAVGLSSASTLRQFLPPAELVTLPEVGHMACEEVPKMVSATVARWLQRTPSLGKDLMPPAHV